MKQPNMINAERVEMYLKAIADTLKGETPQLDGYTYTKMEEWLAYIITILQENGGGSSGGGTTNYNQLMNKPIINKTGTENSPIYLRELETGAYILNGTCSPYNGSETYMGANNAVTFANHFDTVTAIQIFYPPYNQVQYYEVYDDNYTTNTVRLNDLPTKEYVDDTVNTAIENIEIPSGGGEDPFIHLDLIIDYASTSVNPVSFNSTKNSDQLEKLSSVINEYVANPKPILLSIFNVLGTVYKDHYNIVVETFGTVPTVNTKNPSMKYVLFNGYKLTPFTFSFTGTWNEGVYTCTSASITGDTTKDLMGTTDFSTITGRKVFNTLPETNVKATSNNQFTNKLYVDDAIKAAITTVLEGEY